MGKFNQKLVFKEHCNFVLERELPGYRVMDGQIIPITDKRKLLSISDRKILIIVIPIKESISAVKTFCKVIVNKDKATLNEALSTIEKYGCTKH